MQPDPSGSTGAANCLQSQPVERGRFLPLGLVTACTILVVVVLTVYRNSPENVFHFDDQINIRDNAAVRMDRFDPDHLVRAMQESPLSRRKISYLTFALDWWRGQGDPRAFLQTNVALHAASTVLVFSLTLLALTAPRYPVRWADLYAAFWAALLFAIHPIQTQAVNLIVQRMTELACLFTLLAVASYLVFRTRARSSLAKGVAIAACLFSIIGALLSKENAWILPALLGLTEIGLVRRDNQSIFRSTHEKWAVATVLTLLLICFSATAAGIGPLAEHFEEGYAKRTFTAHQRLLTQPRVVLFHISQILWPDPERFSLEHDFVVSTSILEPASTLPALLTIFVWCGVGIWLLSRPRWRLAGFFTLWVPMTLVIESSLVPLEMVFEHRMYLPSFGLFGLVATAVRSALPANRAKLAALTTALTMVALLLSAATTRRIAVWQSPLTLAQDAVEKAPNSARAWASLGLARLENKEPDAAVMAFQRSLSIDSGNRIALEYLGLVLLDQGDLEGAQQLLSRAYAADIQSSSIANHLGELALARYDYQTATEWFRRAISVKPWVPAYHWNLALALEALDRCEDSHARWQTYLSVEPDDAERQKVREHLAEVYETEGGKCYSDGTNWPSSGETDHGG